MTDFLFGEILDFISLLISISTWIISAIVHCLVLWQSFYVVKQVEFPANSVYSKINIMIWLIQRLYQLKSSSEKILLTFLIVIEFHEWWSSEQPLECFVDMWLGSDEINATFCTLLSMISEYVMRLIISLFVLKYALIITIHLHYSWGRKS